MSELAYLGLAVLASVLGSAIILFRQRHPHSLESGIQDFARGLRALDKDAHMQPPTRHER